jgi:hypothetical protein
MVSELSDEFALLKIDNTILKLQIKVLTKSFWWPLSQYKNKEQSAVGP